MILPFSICPLASSVCITAKQLRSLRRRGTRTDQIAEQDEHCADKCAGSTSNSEDGRFQSRAWMPHCNVMRVPIHAHNHHEQHHFHGHEPPTKRGEALESTITRVRGCAGRHGPVWSDPATLKLRSPHELGNSRNKSHIRCFLSRCATSCGGVELMPL